MSADDNASLELFWGEVLFFDGATSMLDFEDPSCRHGFGFHSSPNVPFLMWQLFSRFMASIHWSCDFDLRASPADLGVIVCSCDSVRASSIETGSVGSVVVVSG